MIILLWPITARSFRLTASYKTLINESQLRPAPLSRKLRSDQPPPCLPIQATFLTRSPARASGTFCEVSWEAARSRPRRRRALHHPLKKRRIRARHHPLPSPRPKHLPTPHWHPFPPPYPSPHNHHPLPTAPTTSASPSNGSTSALVPTTTCVFNPPNCLLPPNPCFNKRESIQSLCWLRLQLVRRLRQVRMLEEHWRNGRLLVTNARTSLIGERMKACRPTGRSRRLLLMLRLSGGRGKGV
jgi:hypothetical protein